VKPEDGQRMDEGACGAAGNRRILIVEDEDNLRLALHDNLEDEGYEVVSAANGKDARCALEQRDFDLLLLDIVLPDVDGYTLCRELRERGLPLPVLMLTARTLEDDLVRGFDAGADDYLAKPFRLRELLARVGALLRRRGEASSRVSEGELRFAGWCIDSAARDLRHVDGRAPELTRTEFDLLAYLARSRDRVVTRDQILAAVWGSDVVIDTRTVDNFVSKLKSKLGWTPDCGYRIRTIRGVGYRMEIENAS
jgi:DNA-binding response OmpR family regulator